MTHCKQYISGRLQVSHVLLLRVVVSFSLAGCAGLLVGRRERAWLLVGRSLSAMGGLPERKEERGRG